MSEMARKLPLVNKLMYTADLVGTQAMAQSRGLWLLFFLAPPKDENLPAAVPALGLGLFELDPRVFVGVLLTAGRLIEGLDDPLIGWWSDRTRSRWGRRLPFVLFSTPFLAIFFALLWLNPTGEASYANAIYLFVILELFFLANTISGGPYESLLPEIARSHRDRMSMVAFQFYFGILGALLGLVFSGLIKDTFGFAAMGAMFAAVALGSRYLGLFGVWDCAPRETPPARIELRTAFMATLSNKQFLYFLPTFVFFQLSVSMGGWLVAILRRRGPGRGEWGRVHFISDGGCPARHGAVGIHDMENWQFKGQELGLFGLPVGDSDIYALSVLHRLHPSDTQASPRSNHGIPGRPSDGGRVTAASGYYSRHHRLR